MRKLLYRAPAYSVMRIEYVAVAVVLFIVVLLVILGFAQDILPSFAGGLKEAGSALR